MSGDGAAGATLEPAAPSPTWPRRPVYPVLGAVSLCHLVNDLLQSVIPAVYPILKATYALDFGQIGLITLAAQLTASLLQPVVGLVTDRRPMPYSLAIGMCCTFAGLLLLSAAPSYGLVLAAVACVGLGSAVFHPESSRVARMASGGRYGLAQSVFQVGGNAGSAMGPLLAALVILPGGQRTLAGFAPVALAGALVLTGVGRWYSGRRAVHGHAVARPSGIPARRVVVATAVLVALVVSKYLYMSSLTSYYTFFLIARFHVSVRTSQMMLFLFLGAVAAGTLAGGPIGDRVGRRAVIWASILGVLPFTLLMPFANLFWTGVLSVVIGLVLASAFSAIVVYAQELMPGHVGTVAGLFFGLAFGVGGIGAAALGRVADHAGIETVYRACAFLPALGLLAAFLPHVETRHGREGEGAAQPAGGERAGSSQARR